MKLKNQIAIVSGGGGAIGGAIAHQLAAEGATVYLFDLRAEFAVKNAESIIAAGGESHPIGVNIEQAQEVKQQVDAIHAKCGRIDILVNCAGGSARAKMKPFHEQSLDVVRDVLAVNLSGMLNCTHAVSQHMVKAGSGKIINLGSVIADQGLERAVDYAAAKGAVISATRALAKELGRMTLTSIASLLVLFCVKMWKIPRVMRVAILT